MQPVISYAHMCKRESIAQMLPRFSAVSDLLFYYYSVKSASRSIRMLSGIGNPNAFTASAGL